MDRGRHWPHCPSKSKQFHHANLREYQGAEVKAHLTREISLSLHKLARDASLTASMPVIEYNVPTGEDALDWVHDTGRMLLIGEAAHPFPVIDLICRDCEKC